MSHQNIHQKELAGLMKVFLNPKSYSQKLIVAKIFVMRWALANDINLCNDDPNTIKWCIGSQTIK